MLASRAPALPSATQGIRQQHAPIPHPSSAPQHPQRPLLQQPQQQVAVVDAAPPAIVRQQLGQQHQQQQQPPLTTSSSSSINHSLALLRRSGAPLEVARASPALLTTAIVHARSVDELAQVFWDLSPAFNHIHAAALVARLPKVLREQSASQAAATTTSSSTTSSSRDADNDELLAELLPDLAQLCEELLPQCSGRELANIASGFASLGHYSRRLLQLLLARCALPGLTPQELASLAWAVARSGHQVAEGWVDELLLLSGAALAAGQLPPREASNTAWALAVLQRRCLLASAPQLQQSCTRVDAAWRDALCGALRAQLPACAAQDLAQALWALAVLGGSGGGGSGVQQAWVDALLMRGRRLLAARKMRTRDVACILWSLSVLEAQHRHRAEVGGGAVATTNTAAAAPWRSSNSSKSLPGFVRGLSAALPKLLRGERDASHCAAVLLNACSRLQLQLPPAAMHALLATVCRQHAAALAQQRRETAAAVAAQAPAQHQHADGSHQQHQHRQQSAREQQGALRAAEAQLLDVSMLLHSTVALSYRPADAVLGLLAASASAACAQIVRAHDSVPASSTTAAAAGADPPQQQQQPQQPRLWGSPLAAAAAAAAAQRLPATRGRELSLLLWGLARHRFAPPPPLLRPVRLAVLRQLHLFNAADVGVALVGLAGLRDRPNYSWLAAVLAHFLASLDDAAAGPRSAGDVANVVRALPRLPGGANKARELRAALGPALLAHLGEAAGARLSDCGPGQLLGLAQGFAGLRYCPGGRWLQAHQEAATRCAWSEQEAAALAAAYATLQPLAAAAAAAPVVAAEELHAIPVREPALSKVLTPQRQRVCTAVAA